MSDFLSRLVGRSLGPSQAIQPRAPSLYEPYEKSSGPLWARHEGESAGQTSENGGSPGRDSRSENPLVEDHSRQRAFRRGEPSLHTRQAQPASSVTQALPTTKSRSEGSLEPAGPVLQSDAEVSRETGSRPVTLSGGLRSRDFAKVGENLPDSRALTHSPTEPDDSTPSNATRSSSLFYPASRNGAVINSEDARRVAVEMRSAEHAGRSAIVEPARASAGTLSASLDSSLMAAATIAAAAKSRMLVVPSSSRPHRPEDRNAANTQAVPYNSTANEPAIRVSIGRVEVRAVFPPPPPRRVEPVRPKPSLSLDDYLKQRNRGRQ